MPQNSGCIGTVDKVAAPRGCLRNQNSRLFLQTALDTALKSLGILKGLPVFFVLPDAKIALIFGTAWFVNSLMLTEQGRRSIKKMCIRDRAQGGLPSLPPVVLKAVVVFAALVVLWLLIRSFIRWRYKARRRKRLRQVEERERRAAEKKAAQRLSLIHI